MRRILDKLTEEELSIVARGFELVARAAEVSERKEPFGNG